MPTVRGCNLPDDLLYDVPNNIWYRDNGDGTVTLGMTAVAAAMAGQLVAFAPKKAGRSLETASSRRWKPRYSASSLSACHDLTGWREEPCRKIACTFFSARASTRSCR